MLKRTPLFSVHQNLRGRMMDFGGWEMPVQYTSILDEHHAVRSAAGIFDISHMGEVLVSGPEAQSFLNKVLTNDISKLPEGHGQYTLMCNEQGGTIDDLYAYCLHEQAYLLVINAGRIVEDLAWLRGRYKSLGIGAETELVNMSDRMAAVAVQGPRVKDFINRCFPGPAVEGTRVGHVTQLKKNELGKWDWRGHHLWISRTGYTGEDGFEIVSPADAIEEVWTHIEAAGQPLGLKPCGLGARDTLRTEAGYPLYGHELTEEITPVEAGLSFFVALEKGSFIGRSVMAQQKKDGVQRCCVAFKMTDKSAPPRPHYAIWSKGDGARKIGEVTSGTQSPSLGIGIGLGYVEAGFAKAQTPIEIEIRDKRAGALIVPRPVYRKPV